MILKLQTAIKISEVPLSVFGRKMALTHENEVALKIIFNDICGNRLEVHMISFYYVIDLLLLMIMMMMILMMVLLMMMILSQSLLLFSQYVYF